MSPRVVVLDDWEGLLARSEGIARMRTRADVTVLDRPLAEVPDADLADVEYVMAVRERTRFDAAALDRLPSLKVLLQSGGHAYHVDLGAARERGIVVTHGRRAHGPRAAVPELTFALMIGALRHLPTAVREMSAGGWPALTGRTLAGRRLGLLGTGRHGANVARIAEAFRMDVVGWARPGATSPNPDIPRVPLDELLPACDVVSIHLRLSDEVRGLLGATELASMREGSVLVNTSRGAIVDEPALVEALRSGPLAAAGLDVFADEPLAPDSPLRTLPNALITPHIGWTVEEVLDEFATIAADQLEAHLDGTLSDDEVNPGAAGL
ncbi:NAD(P)-dependent oxidoreductase [Georgenia sp. Z1344]|uniref:NAD(P)-dependent oxidoreductase n=1 Tax=Georgenia sp. Z1344 TaxID=3416706 RepID=UPI003CEA98CE